MDTNALLRRVKALVAARNRQAAYDGIKAARTELTAAETTPEQWTDLVDCYDTVGEASAAVEILDNLTKRYGEDRERTLRAIEILARCRKPEAPPHIAAEPERRLAAILPRLPRNRDTLAALASIYWHLELTMPMTGWREANHIRCARYKVEDQWQQLEPGAFETWSAAAAHCLVSHRLLPKDLDRFRRMLDGARRALKEPDAARLGDWSALCELSKRAGFLQESFETALLIVRLGSQEPTHLKYVIRHTAKYPGRLSLDEANHIVGRLLDSRDRNAGYWYSVGEALFAGGHFEAATTAIEKCLALQPGHTEAARLLDREVRARAIGL